MLQNDKFHEIHDIFVEIPACGSDIEVNIYIWFEVGGFVALIKDSRTTIVWF